jgi:hypothetical protein
MISRSVNRSDVCVARGVVPEEPNAVVPHRGLCEGRGSTAPAVLFDSFLLGVDTAPATLSGPVKV